MNARDIRVHLIVEIILTTDQSLIAIVCRALPSCCDLLENPEEKEFELKYSGAEVFR